MFPLLCFGIWIVSIGGIVPIVVKETVQDDPQFIEMVDDFFGYVCLIGGFFVGWALMQAVFDYLKG